MNVFVAQQNYHIGNFSLNKEKILKTLRQAKELGAELVVFSELSVCGYPPRDLLEFEGFLGLVDQTLTEIAKQVDEVGII
ncbi:MAG: hypothetical protein RL131_594, partial [Bacteroidota bacterium]